MLRKVLCRPLFLPDAWRDLRFCLLVLHQEIERGEFSVLVTATMWWPLSARLSAAFLRQDFRVATASHPKHPLRAVAGIDKHYPYCGIHSLAGLRTALEQGRPQLVVPCDDGAVWQLHRLHEKCADLRPVIERSLGPPDTYPVLRSRAMLLETAAELGIRTPHTRSVLPGADLSTTSSAAPCVLKVDGSCAGNGVRIATTPDEARAALSALAKPVSASTAWKRLIIDRDPLPISWLQERETPRVTVQEYIAGRPANAMLACWKGQVLAIVIVEVLTAQGATGAATVVRIVRNPEIARAACLLAQRLELTGFHGLDFLLQKGTNLPFLIELNPRPTQLGHLRLTGQGDLVSALCTALRGFPLAASDDGIENEIIAFFPQAMSLNPASPYLTTGYHDVPLDQPRLIRKLRQTPWPERQLAARLYHLFYPSKQQREITFNTAHEPCSTGALLH